MKKAKLIFDIGKTNKKFFLFDSKNRVLKKGVKQFAEIEDDDGYPCDDILAITDWIKITLGKFLDSKKYKITAVNFSTYGASLVHIDENDNVLFPFYNYTKPIPEAITQKFYRDHGRPEFIAKETGSPPAGMLNSGLQLFWIKKTQPEKFKKIKWSLHFPQYLSYLFTGKAVSEYTSIGCHTSLWNYEKEDYHDWVLVEDLNRILPPLVSGTTKFKKKINGHRIRVGVGIHDSSAALIPYLQKNKKPFLLISTGTWSVSLNPFPEIQLDVEELKNDCLNYMRIDGKPVKAGRLFLGKEYEYQLNELQKFFEIENENRKNLKFKQEKFSQAKNDFDFIYNFKHIKNHGDNSGVTNYSNFNSFEQAHVFLLIELAILQVQSLKKISGSTKFKNIYVDGGFAKNEIFINILSRYFKDKKIIPTDSPIASALGAAIV